MTKLCCVWERRHCLTVSPLREQRGDEVKPSRLFAPAQTCNLPLCQHLLLLHPAPANYSFTFSWTLYRGTPSHYSSQLALSKDRLLPAKRSARPDTGHAGREAPLWSTGACQMCALPGSDCSQQVLTRPSGLGAKIRAEVMYVCVCVCGKYESQRRHYNRRLSSAT